MKKLEGKAFHQVVEPYPCPSCGAVVERWAVMRSPTAYVFESDAGDLVPHICHPGAVLLSGDTSAKGNHA